MLEFGIGVCFIINAIVILAVVAIVMILLRDLSNESPYDILYLCDRENCEHCGSLCNHTTNIKHAKNFKRHIQGYYEQEAKK